MIINIKLWEAVPTTSHILCNFSLINVLVVCVFTFLFWFRKYSGHIFRCYFLKKYRNQVGRLVHLIMYILVSLLFSLALPPSVFLSMFLFFSALIFFSPYVGSQTGCAGVPKSLRVFRFKRVKM